MTSKEMYIEVTSALQALGANRTRKYSEEEIEWVLNKIISEFPKSCLRKKDDNSTLFEINTVYLQAIRPLLAEIGLVVDYTQPRTGITVRSFLPDNYAYGLELSAQATTCVRPKTKPALTPQTWQVVGCPFPVNSTASDRQFYNNLSVTINGSQVYNRPGFYRDNSVFQLVQDIIGNTPLSADKTGAYLKQGYLLLFMAKPDNANAQFEISYEGSVKATSTVLGTIVLNVPVGEGDTTIPIRNLRDGMAYLSQSTPYYKASAEEMVASFKGNTIQVDTPQNVIVNQLILSYIRKPRRISLSLNTGSDIDPEFHNEICDRAVSLIRERIGDPRYQTGLIESKQN